MKKLNLLILLGLVFALPVEQALAQALINKIDVQGAKRIEKATVVSYLGINEGTRATRTALDYGLKQLFATGLFADVSLDQRGSTLIVNVVENPLVSQVFFEGNDALDSDELRNETRLTSRQIFTRTKVQKDVERLYQIYRRNGRFSAKIEPKLIKLDQNRVDLVFEIDEGDVTKVRAIRFIGNDHYDDDMLRTVISTRENAWYRFISNSDRYDPDRMAYDQELLRQFYLKQGYADFNISSAVSELSQDKEAFYMTFTIDEGVRYKIKDVHVVSHINDFDTSVLNGDLHSVVGEWYNSRNIQGDLAKITDILGDYQYAFVDVSPKIARDKENAELSITYKIDESPRSFIESINIVGNVRTLDKVIRREMFLVEGDPFNKSKLARSEQAIKDLNYFEIVDMKVRPGSAPDLTIVDIEVAEKSTGEVSLGAGFSTSDGVIGDLSFAERNLMGKGQTVKASGTLSGDSTRYDVSFVEPHFLNRDVLAGVNLFNIETNDQESRRYDEQNTGGRFYVNYPLSERWRQTLKYRLNRSRISDIPDTATRFLRSQEGERTTSAVSQRVMYDSRNSTILPTEGYNFWLETEAAGLGFDAKHLSAVTGISYYYPVMDQVTLNLMSETGAISGYGDEDVEVSERFTLGGPTSLRGFERYGVGPRDLAGNDDVGGNLYYRGTVQMSFPVGLPEEYGIKAYAFSDFGSLWDADETHSDIVNEHELRASAGLGVTWRSPFGPIGVYYAKPFMDEDYDQLKEFEVNFGTSF